MCCVLEAGPYYIALAGLKLLGILLLQTLGGWDYKHAPTASHVLGISIWYIILGTATW